jgi:cytochrome P450
MLANSYLSLQEDQFKQTKTFLPERWLKDNKDPQCPRAKDVHPFTYLPFGFGSRMCIGRRFAELEIEVLTARIIREFKLEWHHEDLKFKSITINIPDGPLKLRMTEID